MKTYKDLMNNFLPYPINDIIGYTEHMEHIQNLNQIEDMSTEERDYLHILVLMVLDYEDRNMTDVGFKTGQELVLAASKDSLSTKLKILEILDEYTETILFGQMYPSLDQINQLAECISCSQKDLIPWN